MNFAIILKFVRLVASNSGFFFYYGFNFVKGVMGYASLNIYLELRKHSCGSTQTVTDFVFRIKLENVFPGYNSLNTALG